MPSESCLEYIQRVGTFFKYLMKKKSVVSFPSPKTMICKEKKIDLKATGTN